MPMFEVKCRVDAYVDYIAKVEAASAAEAVAIASDDPDSLTWEDGDTQEFDARLYIALDPNGDEIEDTEVRHF